MWIKIIINCHIPTLHTATTWLSPLLLPHSHATYQPPSLHAPHSTSSTSLRPPPPPPPPPGTPPPPPPPPFRPPPPLPYQEILLAITSQYTDWDHASPDRAALLGSTVRALQDASIVAPSIATAEKFTSGKKKTFFYIMEPSSNEKVMQYDPVFLLSQHIWILIR